MSVERLLNVRNVLFGIGGFVEVGIDCEDLLEVGQGRIQQGQGTGFIRVMIVGQAQGVVSQGILLIVTQGLLAIRNSRVKVFLQPLGITEPIVGKAALLFPDVLLSGALLLPKPIREPRT